MKKPPAFLITCEHATHSVPPELRALFRGREALLRSHRGWDTGALPLARSLAQKCKAPLLNGNYSRLVVDLNRSPGMPGLFSEFTRSLSEHERAALLARIHCAHWVRVRSAINRELKRAESVVHLGVHSFTPVLNGHVRTTDIGLLYDPARPQEDDFCRALQKRLALRTGLRVHRNLPYRGTGDGLTTAMRREYSASRYLGIEIEINQKLFRSDKMRRLITSAFTEELG